MEKLRIVLVGLGGFGSRWAEVVQRSPEARLAAVVDASAQARAAAVDRLGDVPALGSIEEAVALPADAALIVVPPALHEPVALAALEAGWHVLSEKPLADGLPAAFRLVAAVERTGLTFMVSQNYRWMAHVATLRRHLQGGLIGELGSVRYTFNKAWDFGGWRATLPDVLLEDMTIHHADLLRYLTGRECEEVYAQSFRPSWSWFEGHSAASVLMRFGGDLCVNYSGSWVGTGPQTSWTGTIEIEGTDGVLVLKNDELTHHSRGKPNGDQPAGQALPTLEQAREPQDESLARFAAAVREGTRPETDIRDNIQSFAIVCAALASARSGQPVRLAELLGQTRAGGGN